MIECILIIQAEKIGYCHNIKRTIFMEFPPTIGMELKIGYGIEKDQWAINDFISLQITNVICLLDHENRRVQDPVQIETDFKNPDCYRKQIQRLDDLKEWWEHLDDASIKIRDHDGGWG